MRSIYRIKRLALSSNCQFRSQARQLSSTTFWSKEKIQANELDLSDLRRLEASSSTPNRSRWSDAGFRREQGEASTSTIPLSKQSNFFTPFRPSSLPIQPASQVDLINLQTLYPLLHRHPDRRDEEFCTQVWRQYHHLAPSTRRSIHPKVMQMILRAIIPSRATRTEMKRRAKDPVRAIDAYSEKLERRMQCVVADMLRSTWVDPTTNQRAIIPDFPDYQYALKTLAHLGGTEACEAIYRELRELGQEKISTGELLPYRLEALKVWMTSRVKYSSWTRIRPGSSASATGPRKPSMRYNPEREMKDPASHATTVLWSILGELSNTSTSSSKPERLFRQLVLALHQILRFLPETEKPISETVRKILKQALEKGYGIDFKFLRQDPAVQTELTSEIIDSVMYLMGSQGDIWRMVAMYESLTGPNGSTSTQAVDMENGDEDVETLSGALEAEAAGGVNRDWLGREKISNDPAPIERVRDRPPHMPETALIPGHGPRHFNDYLALATSTENPENGVSCVSPLLATHTITTMMESIKLSGDVDLAIHLLRTSLKDTSLVRQAWLGQLKDNMARLDRNDAEESGATVNTGVQGETIQSTQPISEGTPELAQSISQTEEESPSVAQATPKLPSIPETTKIELPQRRLLVSAQWFEAVHLLARSGSDTIWAAQEIRRLMNSELQALTEEHLALTGLNIEDPIEQISPTAPIYSIQTGNELRPFNPSRYLRHLRKTFWELSKLSTASLQQQERRRIATKAKNARRKERQVEAMKVEQEKVEAKQALRRRKDEIQELPLALA